MSRTAQSMALFRALESAKDEGRRLFKDPFAVLFLPRSLRSLVWCSRSTLVAKGVEILLDLGWPGARSSGVARTRLIDDWVTDAANSGAKQIVILGSGFDCRAHRLAQLSAMNIFELDRASLLEKKKKALDGQPSRNIDIVYVPIDLLRDDIAVQLNRLGLKTKTNTVFLWEGVTNYLDCPSVRQVFNAVARTSAPGSAIIFTYIHRDVLCGSFKAVGLSRLLRQLKRWNESWTFGFDPEQLPSFLNGYGFELAADLGASEYRQRYFAKRSLGMRGYEFYRVARADLMTSPEECD